MQRAALLTVCLAFVFIASLGAGSADAQGETEAKRGKYFVSDSAAANFVKRHAKIVVEHQPAVFPNARIIARGPFAACGPRISPRTWDCAYFILMYERTTIAPYKQSTLRECKSPSKDYVRVKRARSSRKLRIVGGWPMTCDLDEQAIDLWNQSGPDDYQPNVTEATPYEPLERASRAPGPSDDDLDILPPPSGEPGTPPLGPLNAPPSDRATISTHDTVCSRWERYYVDTRYWIYTCYYDEHSIFGVGFKNIQNYSMYYWAGDYNSHGSAIGRLFFTGVVPQINYVHS